jgi:hypothetical protein
VSKVYGFFRRARETWPGNLKRGDIISLGRIGPEKDDIQCVFINYFKDEEALGVRRIISDSETSRRKVSRTEILVYFNRLQSGEKVPDEVRSIVLIGRSRIVSTIKKVQLFKEPQESLNQSVGIDDVVKLVNWPYVIEAATKGILTMRALVRNGKEGYRYSTNGNIWHQSRKNPLPIMVLGKVERSISYKL